MENRAVSLSDSLLPASIFEKDYKLAHKFFINKNFEASYELTKKLFSKSFSSLSNQVIDEALFIKIVKLYLTEIGLFINPNDKFTLTLPKAERQLIIKDLKDEIILNDLLSVYGDNINRVPLELLLNLFLVYYSINDLVPGDTKFAYTQFNKLYYTIDYNSKKGDEQLQKLIKIYVFQILVENKLYHDAKTIIETNPVLSGSISDNLKQLEKLKQANIDEEKSKEKKLKDRKLHEQQQREKELAKQKELKEKHNLNYRSIKQIQEQLHHESRLESPSAQAPEKQVSSKVLNKLLYTFNLTKNYLKENSPLILVIIIIVFIATRFVNVKKINLKDKIKETVQMAFKISYL